MRARTPALLAVTTLLVLAGLGPALASPQPTPVCGFCGEQFAGEADDSLHDTNVSVAESTATVRVHENGSATWTAKNELAEGAAALREDSDALDGVAGRLAGDHYGLPWEASLVDARMDGDTAVLVYRDADAAKRHAGLVVVDYLHDDGGVPRYYVNADSFTLRGPEGSVVRNTPASGSVDGDAVTWTGDGDPYGGSAVEGSPYVVFGPEAGGSPDVRSHAAVALATWPIVQGALEQYVLWQTLVFGLSLGVLAYGIRRTDRRPDPTSLGTGLAAVGVLAFVGPLLAQQSTSWVLGPSLFLVLVGTVVADGRFADRLRTVRGQAVLAGVALALVYVAFVALYAVGGALDVSYRPPLTAALGDVALSLPLALGLVLGAVVDDPDGRRTARWTVLAGLSFAAVALSVVNPADPPTGLGGGLAFMFLTAVALVGPVLVGPTVLLGRSLRAGEGRPPSRPDRSAVTADD